MDIVKNNNTENCMYMVMKVAVYNHDIFGIFHSENKAIREAKSLARKENDNHHSFDVVRLPLNGIKHVSNNSFSGQYCEQETVFSISKDLAKKNEVTVPDNVAQLYVAGVG